MREIDTLDDLFDRCIPEPNSGCWLWLGYLSNGYGQFREDGKNKSAHRRAIEIKDGVTLPSDVFACHRCDVPSCANPDHIFAGSHSDNMADSVKKGRHGGIGRDRSGEKGGLAKLTEGIAIDIIASASAGEMTKSLSDRTGVAKSTINRILRGETWKYLPRPENLPRASGLYPRAALTTEEG